MQKFNDRKCGCKKAYILLIVTIQNENHAIKQISRCLSSTWGTV